MNKEDYSTNIVVKATPQEAFKCINSVSKWWAKSLEGSSQNSNDEFIIRFRDGHYSMHKLIELVPDKKIVWLTTDSNLPGDNHEWTNTKMCFEISAQDSQTQIRFSHIGLVPSVKCYAACVNGWDYFIKSSLFKLLTEGTGMPG
jgi:hypothetical protein